ncbi:Methyltransferase-like protein 5 [Datura stramonium]|uniref:Methyltransferase-like protein 5 n=1 Tax=Datura stramonium TaxID=4076 RepID=A0ABS8TA97_DATST|nr:Methyltransferase-like protein 5 [Datura stramonium]
MRRASRHAAEEFEEEVHLIVMDDIWSSERGMIWASWIKMKVGTFSKVQHLQMKNFRLNSRLLGSKFYNHLTSDLKACLLYFVIFPQGRKVSVKRLVRLWLAEGFLKLEKDLEGVAEKCLQDLIDRCLVLVSDKSLDETRIRYCELPNLEVLKLMYDACYGKEWNSIAGGFTGLKLLLIDESNLKFWKATNDNFPVLERLVIRDCYKLEEIPIEFADINTLQLIELEGCKPALKASTEEIQQVQRRLRAAEPVHVRFLQPYSDDDDDDDDDEECGFKRRYDFSKS